MAQSIDDRPYHLIFGVEKSMRYHRRHAGFFMSTQKLLTFITALLGTGVVATMLQDWKGVTTFLGFVVAAIGTVQLVFDLEGKSRENTKALEAFSGLRTAINQSPSCDMETLCGWEDQRRALEAQFVAELDALNVDCITKS